ncbi:putative inactive glycosyltransferase 25 family member 3 [Smittium mucronatum]|uniref:Putative inactive glycosyltransferase 25 family member 3 n=1 Tax=Smittium mucronatum TaxID=133383 RepID=A0A1R0GVE4_9FUNG|nr:putative inactive glycosyltransferase 25 family member 3 [Smittium mucronatum]
MFGILGTCLNLDIEVVDAFNPYANKKIINTLNSTILSEKTDISPGAIGCWLSHRELWSRIVEENIKSALIFEDDVDLASGFNEKLSSVMSQLSSKNVYWDILYVGHCYQRTSLQEPIITNPVIVQASSSPVCMHAYGLSFGGAKKLLSKITKFKKPIDQQVSDLSNIRKINAYSINPAIAKQGAFSGDTNINLDPEFRQGNKILTDYSIQKCIKQIKAEKSFFLSPKNIILS